MVLGTAQIGTVASALRYVAKEVMMGNMSQNRDRSRATVRGQIAKNAGIGEPLITEFLADVPGVNESTVKQHIAILKASAHFRTQVAHGGMSPTCHSLTFVPLVRIRGVQTYGNFAITKLSVPNRGCHVPCGSNATFVACSK
jgi:hypothetical protein